MRLLVLFIAICLVLVAAFVWHLVAPRGPQPPEVPPAPRTHDPAAPPETASSHPAPPADARSPHTGTTAQPQAASPVAELRVPAAGAPQTRPAGAVATTQPTTQPPIRWATDPDVRAARQRLELARATLEHAPYHPAALRDERNALLQLGRWREALASTGRLLELFPDDAELLADRAALLLSLDRALDAIPLLDRVVSKDPNDVRAWYNLAVAHQSLGHLADARDAWEAVIARAPSAEAYAHRGVVLLDLHQWQAAAADFEAALAETPAAHDVALNLALALTKLGRFEEARARLRTILDANPRHVPALNRMAALYAQQARGDERLSHALRAAAADYAQRSLAVDPNQPATVALLEQLKAASTD